MKNKPSIEVLAKFIQASFPDMVLIDVMEFEESGIYIPFQKIRLFIGFHHELRVCVGNYSKEYGEEIRVSVYNRGF